MRRNLDKQKENKKKIRKQIHRQKSKNPHTTNKRLPPEKRQSKLTFPKPQLRLPPFLPQPSALFVLCRLRSSLLKTPITAEPPLHDPKTQRRNPHSRNHTTASHNIASTIVGQPGIPHRMNVRLQLHSAISTTGSTDQAKGANISEPSGSLPPEHQKIECPAPQLHQPSSFKATPSSIVDQAKATAKPHFADSLAHHPCLNPWDSSVMLRIEEKEAAGIMTSEPCTILIFYILIYNVLLQYI